MAVDRCNAVKDAIVAGIWGNSNYDPQKEGQEGARRQILEQIEDQFQNAIRSIYTGKPAKDDEIDWDDPFFAASKAPRIGKPDGAGASDTQTSAEQKKMLEELDQT